MKLHNCIVLHFEDKISAKQMLVGYRNLTPVVMQDYIGLVQITDRQEPKKITDKLENSRVFSRVSHVKAFNVE